MKSALTLPDDNGHPFAETRRRFCRGPRETGTFSRCSISSSILLGLSSSCLSTQTNQECFGIPRFPSLAIPPLPRFLPRAIRRYSVSPCAPITRRNAHLVRGGGPIMVSNHSKLLSTHEFSSKAWATPSTLSPHHHAPEFLIRHHHPPTTNLSESTFDQRLRLAHRCRRLAFLITVMVHATEVETPIVRWRLRC
jgi:hypothetical protein